MTTTTLPDGTKELVDKAKAAGHNVFKATISKTAYVYRSINRLEYRKIQDQVLQKSLSRAKLARDRADRGEDVDVELESGAQAREDGEEDLFRLAVLSPKVSGKIDMNTLPAGVITKIADLIMEASGFMAGQPQVEQL